MYATLADIDRAYPGLAANLAPATDPDDPTGVDTARVERALLVASEEIDTALRGRYALPVDPVPALLTRFAVEIASASLPIDGAADNDLLQARAKAARAALADLRDGKTSLGATPLLTTADKAGGDVAVIVAPPRVFGPGALGGF